MSTKLINATILTNNLAHNVLVVATGIINFLPLFMGVESTIEESSYAYAAGSPLFVGVNMFHLGLIAPLIFDIVLDAPLLTYLKIFWKGLKGENVKSEGVAKNPSLVGSTLNTMETVVFILGMLAIPLSTLLPSSVPNFALVSWCCRRAATTMVFGAFMCSLTRYFSGVELVVMSINLIIAAIFFCVSETVATFVNNAGDKPSGILFLINMLFASLAALQMLVASLYWLATNVFQLRVQTVRNTMIRWYRRCFMISPSHSTKEHSTKTEEEKQIPPVNMSANGNKNATKQGDKTGMKTHFTTESDTFFRTVHVFTAILSVLLIATLVSAVPMRNSMNEVQLSISSIPFILWTLLILIRSMRQVKLAAIENLMALLDAKKQYVRYISHEIRTPLNSAFLGLRLLLDELRSSSSSNARDADRYETLSDVNTSCATAIDILNDLLCFEKLESGILQLHKTDVAVLPFLQACVTMFAAQARDAGVSIELVTNQDVIAGGTTATDDTPAAAAAATSANVATAASPSNRRESSVGNVSYDFEKPPRRVIKATDMMSIDKFKMDQVVRNLISNALKFSPRGGKVTVKAWIKKVTTQGVLLPVAAPGANNISSKSYMDGESRHSSVSAFSGGGSGGGRANSLLNGDSIKLFLLNSFKRNQSQLTDTSGHNSTPRYSLVITVTDQGAGISPENQKRLFKEVVQFNPEKLQAGGGSGFGLYITKGIIDLHEGKISVFSKGEGHGCTFTICLPLEVDEESLTTNPKSPRFNRSRRRSHLSFRSNIVKIAADNADPEILQEKQSGMSSDVEDIFKISQSEKSSLSLSSKASGLRNADNRSVAASENKVTSMSHSHLNAVEEEDDDTTSGRDSIQMEMEKVSAKDRNDNSSSYSHCRGDTGAEDNGYSKSIARSTDTNTHSDKHQQSKNMSLNKDMSAAWASRGFPQSADVMVAGGGPEMMMTHVPRILVVDDSHLNRKMLCKLLRAKGYVCEEADDGDVAVEMVKKMMQTVDVEYDCILMDYVMPRLEGPKAVQQMRDMGYDGCIGGLTGNGLQSDIDYYLSHGADRVFVKPLDIDEFCGFLIDETEK